MMLTAILAACVLLAVGLFLRASLAPLRTLYIPASVIAGVIGFAGVQALKKFAPDSSLIAVSPEWFSWLPYMVAVVFAAMLLEGEIGGGLNEASTRGARSGIVAWIIILGQLVIGCVVYLLFVKRNHPEVPPGFAQLLEVSWAGGHGASTGMAQVYTQAGFEQGGSLAFFLATFGLVYGVLAGIVWVNIAIRKGWTANKEHDGRLMGMSGLEISRDPRPAMYARSRTEVMDPLTLQILILAAAFGLGMLMKMLLAFLADKFTAYIDPETRKSAILAISQLPLFMFTLIGGYLTRTILTQFGLQRLIDPDGLRRIVGVTMEFMIVAAIATMRIEAMSSFVLPVAVLIILAAIWSVITLFWLSRKLLPKEYWFELGLLNYGFSTANTPQGFMLLRIIDPELKTRAAEDYAIAAPLTAPFVGGGVVTFVGFPLLLTHLGPLAMAILFVVLIVVLYFIGLAVARGNN